MDHADDVLRRAPLFAALDDEGAAALQAGVTIVEISRAERLFEEGASGNQLYVILDGKIKLTRAAADGRENLLSVLGPGEMFGELSLFDPQLADRPSRCRAAPASGAGPAAPPRQ